MDDVLESSLAIHYGKDPSFLGILALVAVIGGLVFRTVLRRLPVPFAVLTFAWGMFLGEIFIWSDGNMGALSDSISNWASLSPNTVIVIFLPTLIFESAATVDVHVFRKARAQIFLLAIPGVLINSMLISLVARQLYPWSLIESLIAGSILSATDPVAVVALLRELGAPKSLSSIIEGESLLNDGIAFVLFSYMLGLLKGESASFGGFISEFFYSSGVGSIIGAIIGGVTTFLSTAVFDDGVAQVLLSFIGTFGTFFIADGLLEASGVLSVVVFGLLYASFRDGGISARSNETLGHIWETASFVANTIVFVYSGFLIVFYVHQRPDQVTVVTEVTKNDWGRLGLLYICLNLIRAFSVLVLYPLLKVTGYGINLKWAITISWSGLRGAVGLLLGLILLTDKDAERDFAAKIMFLISGIVGLTLLINAIVAGPLVRYLGINRRSSAAKFFYVRAVELIEAHVNESITLHQRTPKYRGVDWVRVRRHVPVFGRTMKKTIEKQTGNKVKESVRALPFGQSHDTVSVDVAMGQSYHLFERDAEMSEMLKVARIRFLNLVKSSYHRDFRDGAVTSKSYIVLLIDSATAAQEVASNALSDWSELSSHCTVPSWYSRISCSRLQHFFIEQRISLAYQVCSAFVSAHESVVPLFRKLLGDSEVVGTVIEESIEQLNLAHATLLKTESNFPDLTRTIKTRQVTEEVLKQLITFSEELLEQGEIEEKELTSIINGIQESKAYMWLSHFKGVEPQDRKNIFKSCELFIGISYDEVEEILKKASECSFTRGDVVQQKGVHASGIFIVLHGEVDAIGDRKKYHLSYGQVINSLSVVSDCVTHLTCTARSDTMLYFLPTADIKEILCLHEGRNFERNVYFRAAVEAIEVTRGPRVEELIIGNPWNVYHIMNKGEVIHAKNHERPKNHSWVPITGNGVCVLFSGRLLKMCGTELQTPLEPISFFTFDNSCEFDREAVYLWIPPNICWMFETHYPLNRNSSLKFSNILKRNK